MRLTFEVFTGPVAGPHVLVTGGVHGDEFEPMAAIRRLIARFRERPPLRGKLTLVPVVNEPAFRRGSRTAEDGLDLARTCPGIADGSVTESIAHAVSDLIRSADYYIDLHTGGTRYRVLPLVGYTLHPNPHVLDEQRKMASAFGLPIVWGTDPNLNGRTLSVARDAKVPAIYAEYEGGGGCDPAGTRAYFEGCLRILRQFELVQDAPANAGPGHVIEDSTTGSGHLQANHPSPCEGFFEPAVELGQRVQAGAVLGTVTDLLGQRIETVHAARAGRIIVMHTFSRVDAGEGLAVVL